MLWWAIFSHYRRHPLQLVALWGILALATALWSGVWTLTQQARDSMNAGEEQLAGGPLVVRADGAPVSVDDFASLRRHGICVFPWLEVAPEGRRGRVVGVDPLAMACAGGSGPGEAVNLDGEPFVDISEAAELARNHPATLRLYLGGADTGLPQAWQRQTDPASLSTGELADSFLLNLNALGVLVVLVSALLIRSVYTLGLAQRRDSFARLERYGVGQRRLRLHLLLELVALACIGVIPGYGLGLWLADGLAGGFDAAMAGLFDQALLSTRDTGTGLLVTAAMMVLVVLWCGLDLFRAGIRRRAGSRRRVTLILLCLLPGLVLLILGGALVPVFIGTGLILAATGLLTPVVLAQLFTPSPETPPLRLWRHRELGVLLTRLALPLVALQLAAGTVVAIHALVNTFEGTFHQWLDQRLAGDLFVQVPENADLAPAAALLDDDARVDRWHPVVRGTARLGSGADAPRVDLLATDASSPLVRGWALLERAGQPWAGVADGQVLVNEQLARRQRLGPGASVSLRLGEEVRSVRVAGVYADYGRPAGEILMDVRHLPADHRPGSRSLTIALNDAATEADAEKLTRALARAWGVATVPVRDNDTLHRLANRLFDQTFALTRAISYLALMLAVVALLMTGWVVLRSRAWYFQLLSIWGLAYRERLRVVMTLTLEFLLAVWVVALPVGVGLTWVLVARINPLAFGWALPMAVYPGFWLELLGLFTVSAVAVGWLANGGQQRSPVRVPLPGGGQSQ